MMEIIIIRGGGDLASGVIQKFYRSGFKTLILERENPTFIRRHVSFGMAVFEEEFHLEGATSKFIGSIQELLDKKQLLENMENCFLKNEIPVIIDSKMEILKVIEEKYSQEIEVIGLIDAIIAKKNLGMNKNLAPVTIALGPGFTAGKDADVVIETMRGHDLGKLIFQGDALPNTGTPGMIRGESFLRVVYSEFEGELRIVKDIGSIVEKGEIIAYVGNDPIEAEIDGVIRGMIRSGFKVKKGLKIADIDPRIEEQSNCFSVSDKARALGGGALEAFFYLKNIKKNEN